MGLKPSEIKKMTVWETTAVMEVWAEAHGSQSSDRLSDSDADELWSWIKDSDIPKTFAAAKSNGSSHRS